MKNRSLMVILLSACLTLAFAAVTMADDADGWNVFYGNDNWHVTYTAEGGWDTNLGNGWDDVFSGIQPGDKLILNVELSNEYSEDTDWYMENKVLNSLEDLSANSRTHGGGYTYELTYTNPDGEETSLFSSEEVGGEQTIVVNGEEKEGLREATNNLEDEFFFLDTFSKGDKAEVTLVVALDGESQGNDYQNTLSQLRLQFAVEQQSSTPGTPSTPTGPPSTGDTTNLIPLIIVMGIAGLMVLAAAILLLRMRLNNRKAGESR